jgi:uncharacterized protein
LTDVADIDAAQDCAVGPVDPSGGSVRLTPVPLPSVRLSESGWWGRWQLLNRETTLPYGLAALETAGNMDNFRRILGEVDAPYRGFVFNDSDLYKTLEAIGWSLAGHPDPVLHDYVEGAVQLLSSVQAADGYLNSHVQGDPSRRRYVDLADSHELYCAGHLFQAAVADFRGTGERRLLDLAVRFADHLVAEFGAGRRTDYDGHPEVETALVELFRSTGNRNYLELAKQFVDDRGQRIFPEDRRGDEYFQDATPVRETETIAGHAVRALYLESGVVDVAVETNDTQLLDSSLTRWQDMVDHKLYLTGGVGSRHKSEGFGDPYELPPDRAYCETCAAIASIQWNWRLLLATGDARFADLLERTLYNGFAAGTGLDGTSFFYSNPLQVRENHAASNEEESGQRLPWYSCACCPPNIMRLVASLHHYLATTDSDGVQIHQYADAQLDLTSPGIGALLSMHTGYPWDGDVEVRVLDCADQEWTLSLRVPAWATGARLTVNGTPLDGSRDLGYLRLRRRWSAGDLVVLTLDMAPRLTYPDPRVDAIRGSIAIERGPLVYCIEAADNPGVDFAAVRLDPASPLGLAEITEWPGVQAIRAAGRVRRSPDGTGSLYPPTPAEEVTQTPVTLIAIPYYLWANRASGPMRVWLPAAAS